MKTFDGWNPKTLVMYTKNLVNKSWKIAYLWSGSHQEKYLNIEALWELYVLSLFEPGVSWRLDSRSLEQLLLKCSDPIPFTMSRNTTLFLNPLFWMHMWPWVVNYHHNSPQGIASTIQRFNMQTMELWDDPALHFNMLLPYLTIHCISCICCTGFCCGPRWGEPTLR